MSPCGLGGRLGEPVPYRRDERSSFYGKRNAGAPYEPYTNLIVKLERHGNNVCVVRLAVRTRGDGEAVETKNEVRHRRPIADSDVFLSVCQATA